MGDMIMDTVYHKIPVSATENNKFYRYVRLDKNSFEMVK